MDDDRWQSFADANALPTQDLGLISETAEAQEPAPGETEGDAAKDVPWWSQRAAEWARQGWIGALSEIAAAREAARVAPRSTGGSDGYLKDMEDPDAAPEDTIKEAPDGTISRKQRRRSSGAMGLGSGAGDYSDKPSEKIPVPSFSGHSGEEGEIGSAARSFLRKVEAWERVTRLPEHHRGVALYSALKDRAWVEAEALELDQLSCETGVSYFKAWVRERFMDIEVTQVGRIMSQFFRVLKRSNDQSVRSFTGDFDRMVSRLAEVQVTLPETVLAWMFIDKLRLDETGEISLLASAADQDDEACVVSEEIAQELHSAFLAHQSAKSKYEEAVRGRGYNDAQSKEKAAARLKLAKERSYCSACKKKGHWHRDPECPLQKGAAAKTTHFAQPVTVHVVEVHMAAKPKGNELVAIIDTGCASTVVGYPWFERYMQKADERSITYDFADDGESFKFGASRIYKADFAAWIPVCVGHRWVAMKTSVVPCDVPFLMGRPAMKKLDVKIDLGHESVDFGALKVRGVPIVNAEGGHPAVEVFPDEVGDPPSFDWRLVKSEAPAEGVWYSEPASAYMAEATERRERSDKLFYAKRLPPTVEDMLAGEELSAETFLGWWKGSNLQKDFWIERGNLLIRVHVVPRKFPFSPQGWNTEQQHLKTQLLLALGPESVEERIPCRGPQLVCKTMRSWKQPEAKTEPHALWIGRSTFRKQPAPAPAAADTVKVNVASRAMELQEYQITPHPSWGINEVREMLKEQRQARAGEQEAPKGLSKMTLEQLVNEARRCGIILPEKPTKGVLAKMIRDSKVAPNDTIVGFGRYRGWAYSQLPGDYLEWVLAEWKTAESCCDDLARLARWWEEKKQTREGRRKAPGLPADDPEMTATVPPPPFRSKAGQSAGSQDHDWIPVSMPSSPGHRSPSPRRRRPEEHTKEGIQNELSELKKRMDLLMAAAAALEEEDAAKKKKDAPARGGSWRQQRQYMSAAARPEPGKGRFGGHRGEPAVTFFGDREETWNKKAAEATFEQVALDRPELLWVHLSEEAWKERGTKASRSALPSVLSAMEEQALGERAVVMTHPAASALWKMPGVLKWENKWPHQVLHYKRKSDKTGEIESMKAVLTDDLEVDLKRLHAGAFLGDDLVKAVIPGLSAKSPAKGTANVYVGDLETYDVEEWVRNEPDTEPTLKEHGATSIRFDPRVPAAVQSTLRRLHQNLGHLSNGDLARHLKMSGASSEAIKACKSLRCRTCQSCSRPASARPAKPVPLLDFGEVLGIDVIHLKDAVGKTHYALSMVDYASTFHVVVVVPDRTAKTLAGVVRDHWVSWAGAPRTFALDLDSGFKGVFDEMCYEFGAFMSHAVVDSTMVVDYEVAWAATEVNNAKNQLRNKDGYSPRQWVFGVNPRIPGDVVDEENNLAAMSHLTVDARVQRMNAVRQAARVAFIQVQTSQSVQRALLHRSRVKKTHYEPGDLVFIYREKRPEKHKKPVRMWIGPCTVVGAEGQNLWVSKGGRCLLCAPEHLRPAEAEEISELLRVRASMDDVQAIIDEDKSLKVAFAPEEGPDEQLLAEETDDEEVLKELLGTEPSTLEESMIELENMDWDNVVDRRRKCLDDLPHQVKENNKKARTDEASPEDDTQGRIKGWAREVNFGKVAATQASREKQLESELPWSAIDPEDRPAFEQAEAKQWNEHLHFGAVRVLSEAETAAVLTEVPAERVLSSRFAYKDKARAQRLLDSTVPVRAKARLCIGGRRDPDLGVRALAVDAPTASKESLMLGVQCAVSLGWVASIGDVQAAFLNGVEAPRGLFFRQPARGLPGVPAGRLIEIIKGVFGLSTSPRLWFEKLVKDILELKLQGDGDEFHFEQDLIDPCVFQLVDRSGTTRGLLETHVDDLLLLTEEGLRKRVQERLSEAFPISEWEDDNFKYVGSTYEKNALGYKITQGDYVDERLKFIELPKGQNKEEVDARLFHDNRTAVGCLSWLAKETRPDLSCAASFAQSRQGSPSLQDVKETNKAIQQAKEFRSAGVQITPVPLEKMSLVVFHDAAWANAETGDEALEDLVGHKVGSQIGYMVLAVHKDGIGCRPCECSLLTWKSHSCRRVCRSTFAGETMACCEGIECAMHLRARLLTMLRRQLVREPEAAVAIPIHAVTDCKSLYDFVHRCGTPKPTADRRLIIDLASLKQMFQNEARGWWQRERGDDVPAVDDPLVIPFHWVPSGSQLGDILTKQMKGFTGAYFIMGLLHQRLLAARLLPQSRLPLAVAGRLEGDMGVLRQKQVPKPRFFSGGGGGLPSPEDPWNWRSVSKGPIPPILLLSMVAIWMNTNKSWDGGPKMHSVTCKIFGPNMPF
ncbi:GIP [Symbiodinium sp. CCMP2456]|nr:GIP [Symbiodinium sp. CCMP2456]